MKSFVVALLVFCTLLVVSVNSAQQVADAENTISYGAFPCQWEGELHVSKIDSLVYQCINVRGRAHLDYVFSGVAGTDDKFSITVLNATEYIAYSTGLPYTCINPGQCLLKDGSVKKGSVALNLGGSDLFVIVRDENLIQRAFVASSVRVYTP